LGTVALAMLARRMRRKQQRPDFDIGPIEEPNTASKSASMERGPEKESAMRVGRS
jgi:hypothetical protein